MLAPTHSCCVQVAKFDLFSPLIGSVVLRALGVPVTFRRSSASALKGEARKEE